MTYVDGDFQSPRHLVCRGYGPNDHGTRVERGYSGSMKRERQRERHRDTRGMRWKRWPVKYFHSTLHGHPMAFKPDNIMIVTMLRSICQRYAVIRPKKPPAIHNHLRRFPPPAGSVSALLFLPSFLQYSCFSFFSRSPRFSSFSATFFL
jgi:hypothetical protein